MGEPCQHPYLSAFGQRCHCGWGTCFYCHRDLLRNEACYCDDRLRPPAAPLSPEEPDHA